MGIPWVALLISILWAISSSAELKRKEKEVEDLEEELRKIKSEFYLIRRS